MNLANLVSSLEANLQAELGGKDAQIVLLERQERAISARDPLALETAARELETEMQREIERADKRARILAMMAEALGLPPRPRIADLVQALERHETLAPRAVRLAAKRADLRVRCADALRRGRRLNVLVRANAALVEEALGRFLGPDPAGAPLGRGSLVDAEA